MLLGAEGVEESEEYHRKEKGWQGTMLRLHRIDQYRLVIGPVVGPTKIFPTFRRTRLEVQQNWADSLLTGRDWCCFGR